MKKLYSHVLGMFVAAGITVAANAQSVYVEVRWHDGGCSPCCSGIELSVELDPEEDYTFNLSSCARRVNITTSSSSVDIGRFTFLGGPGAFPLDIVLGTGSLNQSDSPSTAIGRDWEGFDASGLTGDSQFAGRIGGDLVGSIIVGDMFRFDANGDILSPIYADYSGNGGGMVVEADTIASSSSIEVSAGNLKRVRSFGGGIFASIEATDGAISDGVSAATDIGTPANPVNITAGDGRIGLVTAREIYADISAPDADLGTLQGVEATHGPFVGSITAKAVRFDSEVSPVSCVGDMEVEITLSDNLAEPLIITGGDFHADSVLIARKLAALDGAVEITADDITNEGGHLYGEMYFSTFTDVGRDIVIEKGLCGLVRIGEQLDGDITIDGTPGQTNEGLTGQVIINANNDSKAWNGSVTIDGTALAPVPYYDNKSANIGGGAVGLVPYYLHYKDCTPSANKINENTTTGLDGWTNCNGWHIDKVLLPEQTFTEVTLHHYGPIEREGTGMPVTVKRRSLAAIACTWTDETLSFSHAMHPNGHEREILISGPFDPGYSYLIEPKDDTESEYLYCGGLDSSVGKVPVHDYDLVIRVRLIQDLTLNGLLEPDDITAWIATPKDTTLDGVTDNFDLIDVTEAVANSGD